MAKGTAVLQPNLGLHYDKPSIAMNPRMLIDGFNFRVKEGKLSNINVGWELYLDKQLNGPVKLIDAFKPIGDEEKLILATLTDIYALSGGDLTFISPRYETGSASCTDGVVTGSSGAAFETAEIKPGDYIYFGEAGQTDPEVEWHLIEEVSSETGLVLADDDVSAANGAYTIRKTFSGDMADEWISDIFVLAQPSGEDEWWATNGVDWIVRWNGTDTQVEVMDCLGFKSRFLRVYQNMMLFLDIEQEGQRRPTDMINSDIGSPAKVDGGLSEQFRVHGFLDQIMAAEVLGDMVAIYSKRTVTVAQFVGDPLIFVFRNVVNGTGLVAKKGVADFGNYHDFISQDTAYRFDGVSLERIHNHVFREIVRQQDPSRMQSAYHHFDEQNGDLLWVVPSTTDPNSGNIDAPPSMVYAQHYLEPRDQGMPEPFSKRAFPFTAAGYYNKDVGLTWDQLTQSWAELNFRWNDQFFFAAAPLNLVGTYDGYIYSYGAAQNADGEALPSYVTFTKRPVVDGRMRGLLKRIYPFTATFHNPLRITAFMSDHAMGGNEIAHTETIDQSHPEGQHFVSPFRRGRYYTLRFGSQGPSEPWELSGYDVDAVVGGRR